MKGLTKAFRRLENVAISNYNSHKKAVLSAYYWLKAAPYLQKFRSVSGYKKDWMSLAATERNHRIFLKQLKRAKLLQRVEINFFSGFLVLSVFRKLKYIKQICLICTPEYDENFKIWLQLHKSFSLAHKLEALEFFGMGIIQVAGLCTVLMAIPNPQNVTSLALNTNPREYQACQQLSKALSSFKSLTKLALRLHQGVKKLGMILEAVKDCPLRDLDLYIRIPKEDMNFLGSFLGKLSQLRTLGLVIETSLAENDEKHLIPWLEKIKNLVFLKSIEMKIIPRFVMNWILNGVISSLGEGLVELKDLERLKFEFPMGNYKDELGCLMKSLQNSGGKMKTLSLDLVQQQLGGESKEELVKYLKGAERLEELELKSLMIEDKGFGEILKEEIVGMKRLKELRLDRILVLEGRDIYLEMLEKVIERKGFEVYSGEWSEMKGNVERKRKIEMREAIKKNRWLKEVKVPMSVKNEFENFETLYLNKWK